jgi:hypothetical protein
MEENSRRRDWKSGEALKRSWSLGPGQDPVEMLRVPVKSVQVNICLIVFLSRMV